MKITKYGHCCMLIEENGVRLLTDPGMFTTEQNQVMNVDALLITHEHADHFHIESVKEILKNNPNIRVITTAFVGGLLDQENIKHEIIANGQSVTVKDVSIEGIGELHAQLHSSIPQSTNVGFMINNKLFYPGDALTLPNRPVDILALPAAAPWLKIGESLDYAIAVKPRVAFPVHDGILLHPNMMAKMFEMILPKANVEFKVLELNKETEF